MLIGVFGPQGSGKTLVSMLFSRMLLKLEQSIKIYTNVNAEGENVIVISDIGEIPFDREPKILILDEAMFSIDSRRAGSESNVVWMRMTALFRKLNFLMVFYNTHTPNMIDNRVRDQLAYIVMCRKSKKQFEYLMLDMVSQLTKPFYMLRSQELYNFTNFDTYDFPNPIDIDILIEKYAEIFKVRNKKDKQRKEVQGLAGAVGTEQAELNEADLKEKNDLSEIVLIGQ